MASTKLDIGNIVRATVRDVTTRFPRDGRLTLQFLFTALIFGVIAWLLFYLATECRTLLEGTRLIVPLAQWATLALLSALFTPLVIAVHRKVILDEAASRGLLATLARPRGRRYFMAAFLIAMPYAAAQIVLGVLGLAIRNFDGTAMLLSFLATITGFIFGIRLAPALPAIAVDKPGPWAAGGLALSDGSAWRIFWILLLTMVVVCIPAGAAGLLATYVFDLRWTLSVTMSGPRLILLETISSPTYLAIFPVYCLWYALVIAAWASALSHIYIAVTSGPVPPNEA